MIFKDEESNWLIFGVTSVEIQTSVGHVSSDSQFVFRFCSARTTFGRKALN